MSILENYTKQTSSQLKSITIKLKANQVEALREYKINLGALVRDLLDDSDLMQEFNHKHQATNVVPKKIENSTDILDDKHFTFEYQGVSYYYVDAKTMFAKNSDGIIKSISKHSYYKHKNLAEKEQ